MRGCKQGDMFLIKCFTETLVDETFLQICKNMQYVHNKEHR